MSLFVASLNSGSNGNCYYIGNEHEAVLIDAGISCREIEKRMANIGLSMEIVKAVFISHEHTDHVRGIDVLSRKYKLPVYITNATLKSCPFFIDRSLAISFNADESVIVGGLSITPFAKHHDAIDPYSFIVEGNGVKIGVITDIGIACNQVIHYFKQCDAAFLEANYDEQMLEEGSYPDRLKKRIRGGKGHISNKQALQLFVSHKPWHLSHLFLSHLSRENNSPELVRKLFSSHSDKTTIVVASRDKESDVYTIQKMDNEYSKVKPIRTHLRAVQMSLFNEVTT